MLFNVELVIPALLMNVAATTSTLTPSPCSTMMRLGNASPPWDTKYTGPVSSPATAVWRPSRSRSPKPRGSPPGRFRTRSGARFLQRRQTRGQLLGEFDFDPRDVRLAPNRSHRVGQLRVEARAVDLLVFPLVETVKVGLNARLLQPPTASGLDTFALASAEPEITAVICSGPQLVGLNMNPGLSISAVTRFNRSGTPSRICGIAYGPVSSSVIVAVELSASMLMRARTTTRPRLNGPAIAGVTILNPNGAPPYGPVRYTVPSISNGCEPAPEATLVVPIFDASGQCPCRPAVRRTAGHSRASRAVPEGCVSGCP